jgi:hypothetical protein
MRLERLFHFWFYATLGLASVCLAVSSTFFIVWMPGLLALTLVLLALAWRHEGRWLLSDAAANHLGVFIAIGAVGWILFQVPRSEEELIAGGVPWPAGLLPHLGPLLMALLVVKVFRPKRLPDFWVIQTIGLMMVTLAAVLADAPEFGGLMVLYLLAMVSCLVLYYPVREQRLLAGHADSGQLPLFVNPEARWPLAWDWRGGLRVLRWTALVLLLGHVLFLTAPRQAPSYWVARQLSPAAAQTIRTGIEPGIDLNRVGRVELSETPAFEVTVRGSEGASVELASNQHWQVDVYEFYSGGRWYPLSHAQDRLRKVELTRVVPLPIKREAARPQAGELYFAFGLKPILAGGLVLAEPVDVEHIAQAPHINNVPAQLNLFTVLDGCDALVPVVQGRRHLYEYGQLVRHPGAAKRFPAPVASEEYRTLLAEQGIPAELPEWTSRVLQTKSELPTRDRVVDREHGVRPGARALVADALCRYLSQSGEYHYSLELRRQNKDIDPAVDFLLNVKEGHCERYAGGLALMLRSVGIPCRVVKGYLGSGTEDRGRYVVLQNQAHSWVQALVQDENGSWQWLVLDPTPSTEAQAGTLTDWLRWARETFDARSLWRRLVLEYNPEEQAAVGQLLQRQLQQPSALASLALLVGLVPTVWGARRAWGWLHLRMSPDAALARRVSADAAVYQRLLQVLARHLGLRPGPGQTPAEFAGAAAAALGRRGVGAELSELPVRIVAGYYAARYGGCAMDEQAGRMLQRLQELLKQSLAA